MPDTIDRILIVATRQIGDVLLTTPLIRAARRRWPAAAIDVLGFKGTLGMLQGNADVARLIEVEPGSGWRASLPLLGSLWRRYDLALITDGSDRAHLYGLIAARIRSGLVPARASVAWWKRRLLQHVVTVDESRHTVDEKLLLLAPWVSAPAADDVVAPKPAALPADVEAMLRPSFAVVQVPSMWRYKQWPLGHYRELVAALLADGHQVLLTGGPGEGDRAKVAEVATLSDAPALLNLAGRLDFGQLATLFARCALYIGPDTSVTHLAAACGARVITLFGPTSPLRWGPRPLTQDAATPAVYQLRAARQQVGKVILMQGPNACVPCGKAGCEDHRGSRSDCLEELAPARVIAEARAVLAAAPEAAAADALAT